MTEQGTAPAEQPDVSATPPEVKIESAKTLSLEMHQKLLDEKKKVQAQLDQLLAKDKEREEANARKRGDFEALLKARDEELKLERDKRLNLETTLTTGQKLNAVIDALGGQVDPRWYKMIDVSGVVVNPDTGEVDTLTVAKVAESLKREWPEMVRGQGRLPAEAPQGSGAGSIAFEEWKKLPLADMKKWKQSQITY